MGLVKLDRLLDLGKLEPNERIFRVTFGMNVREDLEDFLVATMIGEPTRRFWKMMVVSRGRKGSRGSRHNVPGKIHMRVPRMRPGMSWSAQGSRKLALPCAVARRESTTVKKY